MITPDEIARLRELEKKATPGPWEVSLDIQRFEITRCRIVTHQKINKAREVICDVLSDKATYDGDYIVMFRNALPDLLDEIERLNADLAAALKRAEEAEAELRVLRLNHAHGEHDDRCPRCEAERHWKEGAK